MEDLVFARFQFLNLSSIHPFLLSGVCYVVFAVAVADAVLLVISLAFSIALFHYIRVILGPHWLLLLCVLCVCKRISFVLISFAS